MFNTPRANVIESDEGFSVELMGRTGLRYYEGHRELFVDSEVLAGPAGIVMYSDSIKKWEKEEKEISEEEKSKIIENIRRAFRHKGFEIQVI